MSLLRLSFCGFFVGLAVASPSRAQDVLQWETDLARAQQTAAQTNRLVLVHFWGSWCPPCMRMEHEVLSKPGLGTALSPYFVPCKIQVEQGMNEALVKQFGVDVFPSDIVMTPQGQIVHRSKGFQSAERYVGMLQQTAQTALVQARPVAAGAPASPPPAVVPTPVPTTQPSAAAPPPAVTAPSAAATTPGDDRYAYYYRDRGTSPAPPPSQSPAPPTTSMPIAPPVAATPVAAATPVIPPPTAAAALAAGDRYADYRTAAPAAPVAPAAVAPPPAMPTSMPPSAAPTAPAVAAAPVAPPTPTTTPAPAANVQANPASTAEASNTPRAILPSAIVQKTETAASPKPPVGVGFQLPPGSPPLALDGYCPVTVTDKMVWKKGDVRYGAVHRGRTYLFASEEEQKKFLADPDHYSPVISGNDPVVALEKGESVPGKREFGLMCEKRMFLFSSKESYDKFCGDSKRYAGQIFQALQAGDDVKRR